MAEECRRESRLAFPLQAFFYSCLCVFCDQKCDSQAATGHVGDRWEFSRRWLIGVSAEGMKDRRKEGLSRVQISLDFKWEGAKDASGKKFPKRKIFMRVGFVIRCTAVGSLRFGFWNLFNEQLQTDQSSCSHDPTVTHLLLSCDEIRLFWLFVGTKKTRKKTRKRALARV